jgi:hypothetical protein
MIGFLPVRLAQEWLCAHVRADALDRAAVAEIGSALASQPRAIPFAGRRTGGPRRTCGTAIAASGSERRALTRQRGRQGSEPSTPVARRPAHSHFSTRA